MFDCFTFGCFTCLEMASVKATEPAVCPGSVQTESIVPASMFAPDRDCTEDPAGGELEDSEDTNGEALDHIDLSSKVGLAVIYNQMNYVLIRLT